MSTSGGVFEKTRNDIKWRVGRVAEGARLESVFRVKPNVGSNPTLSANFESTRGFSHSL